MRRDIYKGNYIHVFEEEINSQTFEKVLLRDAVIIFPIADDGKILLIKEKRIHEIPNTRLKAVTGFIDDGMGWRETCQQELQEEIGQKAEELHLLKVIQQQGNINVNKYFVVAQGLHPSKIDNPDGDDVIEEIIPYSIDEIICGCLDESIPLNFDTIGFFLMREYLNNNLKSQS